MVPRVTRSFLIVGALVLACLAAPGVAAAAVGIDSYKITSDMPLGTTPTDGPSTTPSRRESGRRLLDDVHLSERERGPRDGAHQLRPGPAREPGVGSRSARRRTSRRAASRVPPAARSAPRGCSHVVAGTRSAAANLPGRFYNAEPLGNEPGRLAAVTDTPFGPPRVLDPVRDHAPRRRRLRPHRDPHRHQPADVAAIRRRPAGPRRSASSSTRRPSTSATRRRASSASPPARRTATTTRRSSTARPTASPPPAAARSRSSRRPRWSSGTPATPPSIAMRHSS